MNEEIVCEKGNVKLTKLILHCLLDEKKLKKCDIKIKNGSVKVWVYHKLELSEIKNYEEQYKKEIKKLFGVDGT